MFRHFKHCIYCFSKLPETPQGVGEHIIPQSIYGFWRVYDVCSTCIKYFGDNVDQLAIKDIHILHAMSELYLSNVDKYLDEMPYVSTDSSLDRKIPMRRKHGRYKNKVVVDGNKYLECAEEDWERLGLQWLKRLSKLNAQDFEIEANRLKEAYLKLKPGQEVDSPLLQCKIRKGQTKNIQYDTTKLPNIAQLIAKITIPFLAYSLKGQQILDIKEIDSLTKFARFGESSDALNISKLPVNENNHAHPFHRLWLSSLGNIVFVDITFFGKVHWRVILTKSKPLIIETDNNEVFDELILVFNFENLNKREKNLLLKKNEEENYICYILNI